MNRKFSAYLAATCTVLLWGMSYIWADRLLDLHIPVEFFVPIRILLAGFLLWILNKCAKYPMHIQKKDWPKFLLLAVCMPFVYFVAETYGLQLTESPTITSLIIATNPVFSMGVGLMIFKEKFSRLNAVGVFITLAGLWLVTYTHTEVGPLFLWGVLILFVAVMSEVSQIAFTKALSATYKPSVIVMYQFLFGAVLFLPLLLTKGLKDFDPALYLSWQVVYPTLSLALLCSAAAFSVWAYAIKNLGVAHTSVFLAVVPLITAVLSFLFGDERLSGMQWCGLAVAMIGIFLTQLTTENKS